MAGHSNHPGTCFMRDPIVIIGIGEMAGVFARAFLRRGHPVFPVTRDTTMADVAAIIPKPALALVAVAETDLHPVLEQLPATWHDRVGVLQNELLPRDWERHGLTDPTVIPVWFEKKKGQDAKVLLSTPVFGPNSSCVVGSLNGIGIPAHTVATAEAMLYELVRKNVYILTINIAGLVTGGTVSALWHRHEPQARAVAADIIVLQEHLAGCRLDHTRLIDGMLEAFAGDPDHVCMGRTAPARLQRTLQLADSAGLNVPALRKIAAGMPAGT